MYNELHDPDSAEFQAKFAETLIAVGNELNEFEIQYEVFKETFIKIYIDTNSDVPTIYRPTGYMKVVAPDTSSASLSPSPGTIQVHIV